MPIGGALIGAAGSLLGGLFGRRSASNAQNKAIKANREDWVRDYNAHVTLRDQERSYAMARTKDDRRYAENISKRDRAYTNTMLKDARRREDNLIARDRAMFLNDKADDRQHAAARLQDDRRYMAEQRDQDIARYDADRDLMQGRSDMYAEKTAASRGIDFQKLRDDAISAGFNPMTAMSMAHAYSREVNYQTQGGVYSPGANYTAQGPGYNVTGTGGTGGGGGGSGVNVPASTVASSTPAAPASFSGPGGGYTSNYDPSNSVSSGKFIADAFQIAADTFFRKPDQKDEVAQSIKQSEEKKQIEETQRLMNPVGQKFGFSTIEERPFEPAMTMGVPPLREDQSQILRPARKPWDRDDLRIPVMSPSGQTLQIPHSVARQLDLKPFDIVPVGTMAELGGEKEEFNAALNFDRVNDQMFRTGPFAAPGWADQSVSGRRSRETLNSYRFGGSYNKSGGGFGPGPRRFNR